MLVLEDLVLINGLYFSVKSGLSKRVEEKKYLSKQSVGGGWKTNDFSLTFLVFLLKI